jgi:hypothetical protein
MWHVSTTFILQLLAKKLKENHFAVVYDFLEHTGTPLQIP